MKTENFLKITLYIYINKKKGKFYKAIQKITNKYNILYKDEDDILLNKD